MIKLYKNTNKYQLETFHKKVILTIFKWLNLEKNEVTSVTNLTNNTNFKDSEIKTLKIIFRKQNLKKHLNKLLIYFRENKEELKIIQKIYKFQRNQLKKGNFNLTPININNDLKVLFTEFFFDYLFKDKNFWINILSQDFSKTIFKNNFKIAVCPYCNIENIFQVANFKIDHFLPKSKFPLLSMFYLNLIPICEACNSLDNGKGNAYITPISNQYYDEIGEKILFSINSIEKNIHLSAQKLEIENFIKLLKLNKKYENQLIFNELLSFLKSFENNLSYFPPNNKNIKKFFISQIIELKRKNLYYLKKYYASKIFEIKVKQQFD